MDQDIVKLSKQYKGLLTELGINDDVEEMLKNPEKSKDTKHIKLDLTVLMGLLFNSTLMDKKAVNALFIIFWKIYKDIPIMKRMFYLFYLMTQDFKTSFMEHLPSIVFLIISDERLRQNTKNDDNLDEDISISIVKWMKGCIALLDKEKMVDNSRI
jgi:hypothetical protein